MKAKAEGRVLAEKRKKKETKKLPTCGKGLFPTAPTKKGKALGTRLVSKSDDCFFSFVHFRMCFYLLLAQ